LNQLVTIGETMVSFVPNINESLRYGATLKMYIAGAESNTAIGLQRLGHSASFITRVGDDSFGQFVLRMIRAEGVDTSYVKIDTDHPTGIMIKEPLPNQETSVHYYRKDSAAAHLNIHDISEEAISQAKVLHFTGITPVLSESCKQAIFQAIEIATANRCAISFDPNIRTKLWKNNDYSPLMREIISKASYLLLGLEEAFTLYGTNDIQKLSTIIFSSGKLQYLAIKNGSKGAWVCDTDHILHIPPVPCHCIDPVGAGDAFNAGFLSGILKGESLSVCGSIAAVTGARATETSGDIEGLVTEREILNTQNNILPVFR